MSECCASITATSCSPASCATHSSGQYVRSRMNSVSTVMNSSAASLSHKDLSAAVVEIRAGGGKAERGGRGIPRLYTAARGDQRTPCRRGTGRASARSGTTMATIRSLALLPFLGILVGVPLLNRVAPLVLGLPFLLAWLLLWIVLTSAIMAIIYVSDPANRSPDT